MKISQILDKIDENQLFVPAFQREYVWKRDDAKKLINSLIKDYPTGTMLTWETNHPPELKGSHQYDKQQGSVKIILDGQQRITTLYMLMRGEIPPYYTEREIKNDPRNLYVNVESLELEYYKKTIMDKSPLWVNITDIFKGIVRLRTVVKKLEEQNNGERLTKEREYPIDDNFRSIENIKDRDFLEQIIPTKASIKEAIDIFYIVNASGVNLTEAELALAQISGYWAGARNAIKQKMFALESKGFSFNLDFFVYALLGVMYNVGSKMEKLHDESNKEKIQEVWGILDNTVLDYAMNIMQSRAYIDHTYEINSVYALIPIITYIYNKPSRKLDEKEIKRIIKWFYYSQIRNRYVSQLQQKLDKDLGIVVRSENPFDELLAIISEERPLEIKPSEFVGRSISHPLFSLMKFYFKSRNAICFGTGLSIRKNMGEKYALERDHIFAYSVLRDSEYYDMNNSHDYSLAQELTNRVMLTSFENRSKSAKFADFYLKEVKSKFPNALKLQSVPEEEELWKVKNYERFLEARRRMLANELNTFLQNITVTKEVKPEVDLKELIESGEHDHLEFKSTLRWDVRQAKVNKKMEEIIMKSIAAFSNGEGGQILVGVQDDGEIIGLDEDYNSLREPNKDQFELHLRNLVNTAYGKDFATSHLQIRFPIVDDEEICCITIKKGVKPLYTKVTDKNGQQTKQFYVRSGNSSQHLDISEIAGYTSTRFNGNN